MLVILKENISSLGKLGELVKIKPRYARIFFSTKKAIKSTKENLIKLEKQRLLLQEENIKQLLHRHCMMNL